LTCLQNDKKTDLLFRYVQGLEQCAQQFARDLGGAGMSVPDHFIDDLAVPRNVRLRLPDVTLGDEQMLP
jgi:hypothetical protein